MGRDIYRQLQKKLDTYSMGFPETESGIEIKILKKLFTRDEAELFMSMGPMLELPEAIAERAGLSVNEASSKLEEMAGKGLLFRHRKGDVKKYSAIPFVHGLFEYKVKNLDRELAELINAYGEEGFDKAMANCGGYFLRTIPIGESLSPEYKIALYEDALEILKSKDLIVVANCICRTMKKTIDQGCDKPREVCFMFGSMAQYYLDNGLGRKIDLEEAMAIQKKAQAAGLVTQPASSQNPTGMCNCCGDCCGVLLSLKKQPKPAELVFSNHYSRVDQSLCTGCGICEERCPMDAIAMNSEDCAEVNTDRCIGCGVCVPACPSEAIELMVKDEASFRVPPKNSMEQMVSMAKKRGVL